MTRWRYAAATDIGLVRDSNQDAVFVNDSLAMVADGMGGHAAGEIASILTTDVVRERFQQDSTVEGLHGAIEAANRAIIADAREHPERFGMGTTIIAVGLTHDESGVVFPVLFNVGDSRAYQLRDGALRQLSEDHSVAEEWVRMGRLTAQEAESHPRRHQLTRALGVEEKLEIDVVSIDAVAGDRLLLCSDGLSNELSPERLAEVASSPDPLDEVVERLIAEAREAGGHDNISAVLLEFDEVTVAPVPIRQTVSSTPPPIAPSSDPSPRTSRRHRRLTWRVWASLLVIVAVVAGFVAIVHWYAYSNFYLGDDTGTIAVYQGQPNGVLWYKPTKVADTQYCTANLRAADEVALKATISQPTLQEALIYAANLYHEFTLTGAKPVTCGSVVVIPRPTTTKAAG